MPWISSSSTTKPSSGSILPVDCVSSCSWVCWNSPLLSTSSRLLWLIISTSSLISSCRDSISGRWSTFSETGISSAGWASSISSFSSTWSAIISVSSCTSGARFSCWFSSSSTSSISGSFSSLFSSCTTILGGGTSSASIGTGSGSVSCSSIFCSIISFIKFACSLVTTTFGSSAISWAGCSCCSCCFSSCFSTASTTGGTGETPLVTLLVIVEGLLNLTVLSLANLFASLLGLYSSGFFFSNILLAEFNETEGT